MVRLTVTGTASTQMLLRVVNLLAQRGLMPATLHADVTGEVMAIRIDVDTTSGPVLDCTIEKLRAIVEVEQVTASEALRKAA